MEYLDLSKYRSIRTANDSLVLNTIRQRGPISRVDIAKLTNLTAPTVTNISGKLIDWGFVVEYKMGKSSGGRRPILLKINPHIFNVIVIHLSSNKLRGFLISADLQVLKEKFYSVERLPQDQILGLISSTIADLKVGAQGKIPGIGIVIHGLVNSKEGISIFAPNLGWRNVPIKYILEEKFKIPTFVENDVRAMAIGEFYYGTARNVENMVFLKVGYGIGSDIFMDGRLYRGPGDSAGEIGHTTIDASGPKCSCGNFGCLEAMASENALVKLVTNSLKEGKPSVIHNLIENELDKLSPEIIYEAALKGDDLAKKSLRYIAKYLGIGVANMVNIFNPELIIIGGGLAQAKPFIEDTINNTVKKRALDSSFNMCKIEFSVMGEIATIKGAADIVLKSLL